MMPTTSFAKLEAAHACVPRYRHLATALGGITKYGRDTPITLLQILDANGFDDALWALRACDDAEQFVRLLLCDYAEHVLPIFEQAHPDDMRPREAIAVARRYARGKATDDELAAARGAARDAARDATRAAMGAAALAATGAAAWDAAHAAAGAAARTARRAAAWDAASAAAWAAACDAAWAAAWDAAWGAAHAAEDAWQANRLRELLNGADWARALAEEAK